MAMVIQRRRGICAKPANQLFRLFEKSKVNDSSILAGNLPQVLRYFSKISKPVCTSEIRLTFARLELLFWISCQKLQNWCYQKLKQKLENVLEEKDFHILIRMRNEINFFVPYGESVVSVFKK